MLHGGVKKREVKKGQIPKVFEDRFDARECYARNSFFKSYSTFITILQVRNGI